MVAKVTTGQPVSTSFVILFMKLNPLNSEITLVEKIFFVGKEKVLIVPTDYNKKEKKNVDRRKEN